MNNTFSDKYGNVLDIGNRIIRLILQEKNNERKRTRVIGEHFVGEHGYYLYLRRKNRHIFRKNNSWGINYNLLSHFSPETIVSIVNEDTRIRYYLPIKEIQEKQKFLQFSGQGYELQVFIPLSEWRNQTNQPII